MEEVLNFIPNSGLGDCPYVIHFKKQIERPWQKFLPDKVRKTFDPKSMELEIKKCLSKREERQLKKNKNIKPTHLQVGELILLKSHLKSSLKKKIMSKLSDVYIGPFVINQCLGDSRYVIKKLHSDSIIGTYLVSHMKKYEQRK